MIKRVISFCCILFCSCLFCGSLQAGEIKITSVRELVGDGRAAFGAQVSDSKGKPCALVIFRCPYPGMVFDAGSIVKVEEDIGQYNVWVQEGYYMINLKYPGCLQNLVNFRDYGVLRLKAYGVYEVDFDLAALMSAPPSLPIALANETPETASEDEAAEAAVVYQPRKRDFEVGGVQFSMMEVPGGSFTMGCSKGEKHERKEHKVTLSSFLIGETEVTQELWVAVMGKNPSKHLGNPNFPVESVIFSQVDKFIKKLNDLTGRQFRLPTEAEWEYAARGGEQGAAVGCVYSGSSIAGNVAWYVRNADNQSHEVKTLRPNQLGIYDMSGNVAEWTSDWFYYYSDESKINPSHKASVGKFLLAGSKNIIFRGGSYRDNAEKTLVYRRSWAPGNYKNAGLGFRLVLDRP